MKEANYKLILVYDGTNYHGFQRQKDKITIQGVLENALKTLYDEEIKVTAAGRTDARVHARGQVTNFRVQDDRIPSDRLPLALNSILPGDISVKEAEKKHLDFDARRDAKMKRYRYFCYKSTHRDPFLRNYAYFLKRERVLDYENMKYACQKLVGVHDFTAFSASGRPVKNKIREIYSFDIIDSETMLVFEIKGSGFLYKMVRLIVGTIMQVGEGKLTPAGVERILENKDKHLAGPTISPQGLFLEDVYY